MDKKQQTQARLIVVLGIIQQLLDTRQATLFGKLALTKSQFSVLNHFTHNPKRSWLVTELAEVMEMNQPGITKTVSVLIDKGLLLVKADVGDKRKRHLSITSKGMKMCQDMMKALLPDISHCFSEWDEQDLSQFGGHLETLMSWLDNHRDDILF